MHSASGYSYQSDCQHGIYIQKVLQENYDSLQNKFEQELNSITLQSLIDQYCENFNRSNKNIQLESFKMRIIKNHCLISNQKISGNRKRVLQAKNSLS